MTLRQFVEQAAENGLAPRAELVSFETGLLHGCALVAKDIADGRYPRASWDFACDADVRYDMWSVCFEGWRVLMGGLA